VPFSWADGKNGWHRIFKGTMSEIATAACWIESIAADLDLPGRLVFDMQVCLEELMSNIVRHGGIHSSSTSYLPQTDPANGLLISITVNVLADRIILVVEDNGRPFNVAQASAKLVDRPLEEVQPGGLGIHLIKSFANSLEYRRTEKGNRVTIEFTV
jgi:anti-sigma regulatory factor (Ser/Thr protein kinase)